MSFIYNLADTWNASGTTFASILMNVTNGSSANPVAAAASQLINLQTNGTQNFGVRMPHFANGSDATPFLNLVDTWNTSGNITGILYNTTNTASGSSSKLMDLQLGAASQWNVTKAGATTQVGSVLVSADGGASLGASGTGWANLWLSSGGALNWSTDLILTRSAAAKLQLGAADAASPIAQTLQVQGATGANTSAVNWTQQFSLSTGSGTAGTQILTSGTAMSATVAAYSGTAVTVSSASPAVVTLATHGFAPGQVIQFAGSPVPTGITAATNYWVSPTALAAGTFQISSTWPTLTPVNTSTTGTSVTITSQTSVQNGVNTIATWGPSALTGSQTTSLLNLAQVWNTSGTPTALKINVTNIASGASSLLMDLQVGGTSIFNVAAVAPSASTGVVQIGGGGNSVPQMTFLPNSGNKLSLGMANSGAQLNVYNQAGTPTIAFSSHVTINSGGLVQWTNSSSNPNTTTDLILSRAAAASLQLGAADAASPVAQTLQVQSVAAGNANTAGANWTWKSSLSNGSGLSGDIIIQTGDTGAASGTQNAQNSALTIKGGAAQGKSGSVVFGSAAIATNANDGFVYLVSGAGTPTGTPTTFTGRVALYIDTTNSQLWLYLGGAWKQPKTPAAAATVTWQ